MRKVICPNCGSDSALAYKFIIQEDDSIVVAFECECWEVFDIVYDVREPQC